MTRRIKSFQHHTLLLLFRARFPVPFDWAHLGIEASLARIQVIIHACDPLRAV